MTCIVDGLKRKQDDLATFELKWGDISFYPIYYCITHTKAEVIEAVNKRLK